MTPKRPPGRPEAAPGARRVNVPLRLPEWLAQWIDAQDATRAEVIEAALLKAYKIKPPKTAETTSLGRNRSNDD